MDMISESAGSSKNFKPRRSWFQFSLRTLLQLYACKFVDADFQYLNDLKHLNGLRLSDTNITDQNVLQFAQALPNINWLYLDGTSITDASLDGLVKLNNPKAVSLPKHLSKEALKNLTSRFPNCNVSQ